MRYSYLVYHASVVQCSQLITISRRTKNLIAIIDHRYNWTAVKKEKNATEYTFEAPTPNSPLVLKMDVVESRQWKIKH